MSKQNELSLDELKAISAGVKDGGCIIIRPCFPMPPLPINFPGTDEAVKRI